MSLKMRPTWPMPIETADVGKVLLTEECPSRLIGDKLFDKIKEQDFADLYTSSEGKPGLNCGLTSILIYHNSVVCEQLNHRTPFI